MKKTLLVSSLLLAPALIYTQEVQAQEFQQDSNIPLIDHAAALKEAQNQGILIVQDQTQTLSTIKAVDQAYIQQTQELQAATNQYVLEKEKYTSDLTNYEAALKEIEKYQQAEENRQKEQEAAQNQYQQELAAYEKEQAQYQQNLETYQQQEQANSQSKANYQKELEQFEKNLTDYQNKEQLYQKEKAEQEQAQKSFQEKQAQYEKELNLYQEAEKAYQAALAKAQEDSQKEGFLSQAYAQYLIAKSEPNATVRFEGVDAFIGSPHDFGPNLDGIAGTITKLPPTTEATLFKGAGSGTPAGSGDGYGVILEKNKPIRVLYSNLANTSYNGKKITRLDYTYELLSTFAEDGKATAFIYTDPTKTIYVGTHGNNQGQVDFAIRQTMTYYFEDGSPVIFDKDKTALLSFASRNNSFEFGEQEFVQLESNLTFIPITGSSVSGENSYVAARGSNNSKADGSKFDRSEWDQDGHENEYYGAGVALVTGGEISFTFGIRYNPQDIQKASKPSALRDRSRQWFTVNADIKARGLINTEKPGNPPVAPTKPSILSKNLETPSKPVKPTEPTYSVSNKPTAPKKPQLKEIPPLPPLTVEAVKPTPPKAPVVFLHQILYKVPPTAITINRPSRPIIPTKPSNQTRPKPVNPVAKTRLSKTNTVPSRTYPTPARQYSLGQKISYTPIYSPSTQIYYPSYTPSWTPARPTSPSPSSPTPPKNNPSGNTGKSKKPKKPIKAEEAKDPKDHFGINTGISKKSGDQQKLIAFIKEVGQKAREQNKHLKHNKKLYNDAVNKDISTALAHRDYSTDKLQKLLTKFGSAPKGQVTIDGMSVLSKNHTDPNARIDLSHSMATLASTYNHGPIRSAIKSIGSIGSYPIIVFPPNMPFLGLLNYKFINYNINKSTLQLNSFVGDIYTTMNIDDVNADIDSMILARHPKFKNLPMDQRIIKYYSTPNLDSKRKKLFWSLYSDNKEEAQQKAINEILISLLTVGGIGLIMYSKGTGKFSLAKGNIELLDKEIFDGKLRKRLEMSHGSYFNPFSSTNKNSSKGFPKITLPKIKLPKISLPAVTLPKIKLPKINLSKWNPPKINLPKWNPPKINLPKWNPPKINLPKWNPPKINLPKWNPPKNTSRKKGRKK